MKVDVLILLHIAYDLVIASLVLGLCTIMEHVAVLERVTLRQRLPGILFQAVQIVLGAVVVWPLQQVWTRLGLAPLIVPLHSWLAPLPGGTILYFLVLFAISDFLIYWRHRAEHLWFWPIHAVHHAPRELHAANDFGHPLQAIPNFLFVSLPLSLVQMNGPGTPFVVGLMSSLLMMYLHSPIDVHFGPLRRLIADNRFHRIHHSLETRHYDRNFSVGLSLWDALFGTAYWPARDEWPSVGVPDLPAPRTLRTFLLLPFRSARSALPSTHSELCSSPTLPATRSGE